MRKDLSENILPHFQQLFKCVINFEYFRLVVKGGRNSGKSVFVAMCVILGTLIHRRSAICILRHKTDVAGRLDNTIIKALGLLGLRNYFRYVQTKHEFILLDNNGKDTDYSIVCTGADDPETLKGKTSKAGSYWCLWIEEATNFSNIKAINNIESTIGRGDLLHFISIISYNPRQNNNHFLNKEYENIADNIIEYQEFNDIAGSQCITSVDIDDLKFKQCVYHCTYKALKYYGHTDWIGAPDLVAINIGEKTNSEYYRWYYLGEVSGADSINVFRNIKDWDGDTSKLNITKINRGLDYGSNGPDPWAYTEWYFDKKELNLYCLAEYIDKGGTTIIQRVADGIRRINKLNLEFYIDSGSPIHRDLLTKEKLKPVPAKKAPGSIDAGILWLQSLQGIYICKKNTPTTYKEFTEYEYIVDKYEEVTKELPDKDNHTIDSCRYANNMNIRF